MTTRLNPPHADRRIQRLLLQFEIDELAAYLDGAIGDPAVSCEDVAAAATRHATLVVQLKKMMQERAVMWMGAQGYA